MQGDPPAPGVGESTAQQLQAYIQNLPTLLGVTSDQIYPLAQKIQDQQKSIAPQQQDLQNRLLKAYAPGLYDTGNALNKKQLEGGASNALDLLNGKGGQLANKQLEMDKAVDPEYYKTREQTSNRLSDLLGSININGLSGSERAEIERGLGQQDAARGLTASPSQTATVSNAMNFGSALAGKRNQLSQAIQTATSFLPSAKSGVNTFQTGTGQATAQANPGAGQFLGIAGSNTGEAGATGFGSNVLGNINNTQMNAANINANRRDSLDRVTGVMGSLPSISD